jgi:arylsulfatase A-like enzyme
MVSNLDLAPTIVALTGARARRKMDGRPLLPLALDPQRGKDRTLLIEGYGEGKDKPPFAAVRDPRWFYAEYRNGDRELYDLQNDPFELRSLHADPAFAAARQDLARRLARLRVCVQQPVELPPENAAAVPSQPVNRSHGGALVDGRTPECLIPGRAT